MYLKCEVFFKRIKIQDKRQTWNLLIHSYKRTSNVHSYWNWCCPLVTCKSCRPPVTITCSKQDALGHKNHKQRNFHSKKIASQSCHKATQSKTEIALEIGWVRTAINRQCCYDETASKGTTKSTKVNMQATCQSIHGQHGVRQWLKGRQH